MKMLLISESFIVREALKALFTKNLEVSSIEVVNDLCNLKKCDLQDINFIFLDMKENLSDKMKFLHIVKEKYENIKIITLDLNKDINIFKEIVEIGVEGYIVDIDDKDEFIYTIKRVFKGKKVYEAELLQAVLNENKLNNIDVLTPREKDVLHNISKGYDNKEIAKSLYISNYTVKKHVSSILKKLNLKNRQEAIVYVNKNKFKFIS